MWLTEKFFNLNQKKMLGFIENSDLTEDEAAIFRMFYLVDNLDIQKLIDNTEANSKVDHIFKLDDWERINRLSADPIVRMTKIKCTPTLKKLLDSNEPIPMGFPEWFYIAYPDVTVWIMDNSKSIGEEFKGREDEIISENGPNLNFYRKMIDRYKKRVGKLECSV